MSRDLKRAIEQARRSLAEDYGSRDARVALRNAERQLAAARNEPWAEPLDLGESWDAGAPLPHLLSNSHTAVLICIAGVDGHSTGNYATSRRASDPTPTRILQYTFTGCHAVRLGGPNDEALPGHPLYTRGLDGYRPHLVHNSAWITEQEAINAVHPYHRAGWADWLNHYFFVFHDEICEALAESLEVRTIRATLADSLSNAVSTLVDLDEPH